MGDMHPCACVLFHFTSFGLVVIVFRMVSVLFCLLAHVCCLWYSMIAPYVSLDHVNAGQPGPVSFVLLLEVRMSRALSHVLKVMLPLLQSFCVCVETQQGSPG